jgi:hypothetical protein
LVASDAPVIDWQNFSIGSKAALAEQSVVYVIEIWVSHIPTPLNIVIWEGRIDFIQIARPWRKDISIMHLSLFIFINLLEASVVNPKALTFIMRVILKIRSWWHH